MRRRRNAAATLGIGLWLVWLIAPQPGMAKIRCQQSPSGAVLSVSVTEGTYAGLRRNQDSIAVFDLLTGKRGCKTDATVTSTEQIKIFAGTSASAFVELTRGPFAPGLGTDEDASPEIEFEASGSGYIDVIGARGPDHYRFMDSGLQSGVNLNPDEDDDLDLAIAPNSREEMLFVVEGGGGNDEIDALGNPALDMFAAGGDGDDKLIAPPGGAILEGERGADRLIGGRAEDFLIPGRGADRVDAGRGSDLIEMQPDHSRDRINCGLGRDFALVPDEFDRLISCR